MEGQLYLASLRLHGVPSACTPMHSIQRVLAVLRRLILGNRLVRASVRGLLFLLSLLSRATTKHPSPGSNLPTDTQNYDLLYPRAFEHEDAHPYLPASEHEDAHPYLPASEHENAHPYPPLRQGITYTSASLMPTSLHPYLHSGPSASRSSQDIGVVPITQESYSLHSLSVQHLPATASAPNQPDTLSVYHLPALPPSPNLGPGGYLPSTNTSYIDLHIGHATESPNPSRRSSICGDAMASVPPLLTEAHPRIFPGTPESVQRYERKVFILNSLFASNSPPPGWKACLHPEGAQYFFHEENRVFTDANLFDSVRLDFIDTQIHIIRDFLRVHNVHLSPDVDLVLDEYLYDDGSSGCQYYFVNHQGRCVFWMDHVESDMFSISSELNGITSASHIRHELEAQYWYHCELFPRSLHVTNRIVDELRDIVLHALGDLITSATSTVSWKVEDLDHMVNLIDGFGKNVGKDVDSQFSGSSCLVGRLMHVFVRARVYNFHGEPGARLNVDQSVYATPRRRTLLIRLLNPLLFYAPDFHLDGLHTIYTDGLIRHRGWSEFITRLTSEWQEFTLYATVVLNANVAFLSIQSVDQTGDQTGMNRSPTQISSYLSMLTSIGAIIIGLLLVKQNRNRDRVTAPDAALYIFNRTHRTLGLETLAVLYSLPYAMLIWSMVSFLAAFSFMCFENADLITRTLVAILWAAVAALILWCVFNGWESGDLDWGWRWLLGISSANGDSIREEKVDGDAASEDAKSAAGQSKPQRRRWVWPSIMIKLRKGSVDSDRTVINV
ncbi:hypothetical protein GGX14DRAFT_450025 [Mycena pura]|uniref:Uncharacterized protein n=1 Tax=Mycena pura TaxID=153505 RepID=A0AAD6VFM3_9AGAR|nr:hypothetical protein GGX14DRAFT_450025 [Mycena pura]